MSQTTQRTIHFSKMRTIQRAKNSFRKYGIRATIFKFYILIVDFYFDFRYGIDTFAGTTLDNLTIESDNKERGVKYQVTRVIPLRMLFNSIESMIPTDSRFVDFGCGKGRVLLVASQFGFSEVRGVEFAHELCEIARNNCAVYKAKTAASTQFQIIESDAVDYVINTDENVFFMFNPFDKVVLHKILDNIATSLKSHPRKTLIIYYNPAHGNFIEQHNSFVKSREFVHWGYNFTVYSSSDQ